MNYALPLTILLALTACNAPRSDEPVAATPPPPGSDQPADDVPPATAPAAATAISATSPPAGMPLARYDGYGDLRFGMTADEAKSAWAGDLNGAPGKGDICHYLNPVGNHAPSYFALMIENGKFVRYDVGNDTEIAPGGGRRGMAATEIRTLYDGRIDEQPHKYLSGGKNLRIRDPTGNGVLIFEVDAAGKVTAWRAGVPPQVDYVEGCS